ncbi:Ank domain-containing protein/Ank_2 domain-containing protein/Ank_5 domain-containing protein [Cephalotus follicularis]|uniref:Ank domain-containing protein/Ank_2 domain-containing protein/Ank_5 domain-containing protein n=1 Tax=Cephalotus follicularis TaxID=3775 RepID=A0A1Q3CZV0_CEPFO|nr:Ank domain-containing protein/Ank_2 domain-containing protein/Ank_5 domain-containing protein [Cephalotus follicularis]
MPPMHFPLRWESTGDQWWYASPIDWAAANGHYDLVRELIRIDNNHLIQLTSLRRIRRLELVWDDEEQFDDVAKCRSRVARKLFHECESKGGKYSLIRAGYGGWLIYTAASAGDLNFVQELLERNPLLVFGEGEFGVTDTLYAAARSRKCDVFRLLYDFAVRPRFLTGKGGEFDERIGDIPSVYKWEMKNRALHAAARGGNVRILKELIDNCSDVLAYRDKQGSTILHAAAGRGQIEVVKYLIASFDIINSTNDQGNTALHIAAFRGQSAAVEALIVSSPSLTSLKNNAGETFLHMAVSGFQSPGFRRLDRQVEMMKKLVAQKSFNMEDIINAKNNDGRTALHMAVMGNIHYDLVQLLMSTRLINVNIRDAGGLTPLDIIRRRPRSASSDILIRQLMSAGGIFGCQDYTSRRAIASHIKMQGNGSSPGTSFKISDTEIFLYTGIEMTSDGIVDLSPAGTSSSLTELNHLNSTNDNNSSSMIKKPGSVNYAVQRLKSVLRWPRQKENKSETLKKSVDVGSADSYKKCNTSDETPAPLRQRFSKPASPSNNKRTFSVRSNQSSPTTNKRFASGPKQGVMQSVPHLTVPGHTRSSSLSQSSISSPSSLDKHRVVFIDNDAAGPSCSNQVFDDGTPSVIDEQVYSVRKRSRSQYLCFGGSGLSVRNPVSKQRQNQTVNPSILSMA